MLRPGGSLLVQSHMDVPLTDEKPQGRFSKLFSRTVWERLARSIYYRGHGVGRDDHMMHIESSEPIRNAMQEAGFIIEKWEEFKRHYFVLGVK